MREAERRRYAEALSFALEVHAGHRRKGTEVPYASHLLQVSGKILEHGGDVDQAIAGLLHDAIEDSDHVSFDVLLSRFGADVAAIVSDCTDTLPGDTSRKKSPWRARKERYLGQLRATRPRSLLVAACDKSHNVSNLVNDLRVHGPGTLERFSAGAEEQLWYFESVCAVVAGRIPEGLERELSDRVAELHALLGD